MSELMDVVVCDQPGELTFGQRTIPQRSPDEILIRVRRVGICGTDMHIYRGTQPYLSYPRVMGHEIAGEVVEAPSTAKVRPADPVFVMPYLNCGRCAACCKNKPNCCMNLQVLGVHRDGALAQYLSVPAHCAFVADGISLDQAAMIEFLAIGAHAVRRSQLQGHQRVLVSGAGPIGMACALFATLAGAEVTVFDLRETRLAFCRERLKVARAMTPRDASDQELRNATDGEMFDVVFDATGNAAAMQSGFNFIAHGGTYVLVSVVTADIAFSDPEFHRREATLMGSRNATAEDFETVLHAMRAGQIPTHDLNTHETSLAQLPGVLPSWMDPNAGVIKGIVHC